MSRRLKALLLLLLLLAAALPFRGSIRSAFRQITGQQKSLNERLVQFEPEVRSRLTPDLQRCGLSWTPSRLVLIGFKKE